MSISPFHKYRVSVFYPRKTFPRSDFCPVRLSKASLHLSTFTLLRFSREKEAHYIESYHIIFSYLAIFGSAKFFGFVVFWRIGCRLRSRVCVGRVESVIGHSTGSQITFAQEHVRCLLRGKRYDYNLYISITTRNESQRCPKL